MEKKIETTQKELMDWRKSWYDNGFSDGQDHMRRENVTAMALMIQAVGGKIEFSALDLMKMVDPIVTVTTSPDKFTYELTSPPPEINIKR